MKFLIVSIGDLHISSDKSIKEEKFDKFLDLVLSRSSNFNNIVFVINGDLVNTGNQKEYDYALDKICYIQDVIQEHAKNVDVSFVLSPGNHDCDISLQNSETALNLKELKQNINTNDNQRLYKEMLKESNDQSNFFLLCDVLRNPYINVQNSHKDIFRTFDYNFEKGSLRFTVVNSSLFYNRDTNQGEVYIDIDTIQNNIFSIENSIHILVSHYPVEWFNRLDGQRVQKFINSFDVLIFGHEHFGEVIVKKASGKNIIEVRNPMFNSDYKEHNTGLTLMEFDSSCMNLTINVFEYDGKLYDRKLKNELVHSFKRTSLSNNYVTLLESWYEKIKLVNEYIVGNTTTLIDSLYVDLPLKCANLENFEIEDSELDDFEYVSSNNIDFEKFKCFGFYGKLESGKTTLLNHIYSTCFETNYVPIMIEGSVLNRKLDSASIQNILNDQFAKQYSSTSEIVLQQPQKVFILIDNLHDVQNIDDKNFILEYFSKNYKSVVFTSSITYQSTDLNTIENNSFIQYEILEFGQKEIYELVEKWTKISKNFIEMTQHKKVVSIKNKINDISMKKNVPLTPFFVLMILKANDDSTVGDLTNSHKKVYYEYLISKLIIDITFEVDFSENDIHVHLTELAYFIFSNKKANTKDFAIHMQNKYTFDDEYDFRIRDLKNVLIKKRIINLEDNIISFQYKFMYYIFLAQYITEHIDDNPIDFGDLFTNILDEENANILLFLSQYYAKNSIIDQVVSHADELLKEFREIEFINEDLEIYNRFISGVKKIEKLGAVKENHLKLAKSLDDHERKKSNTKYDEKEIIKKLNKCQKQMISAAKMLQVINELLFSRHTSENTTKLLTSAISLGRRVQSFYTYEYILELNKRANEISELQDSFVNEEENLDYIKRNTSMFLNILMFSISNLGNIKNLPALKNIILDDDCYSQVMEFLFQLKNEDDEVKFNMTEIKKLVHKFEKNKNFLLKGLIYGILNYHLNYVGLPPRKITEISQYLKLSEKNRKKLLSKSLS